ncbi:MAG: MBL fold metallo-hydrolase [bacterium]|nr:MBL fold metallo-hydrolase [bacterium]
MYISWYGLDCLKIENKTNQNETCLLTDPFDAKAVGLKLPRSLRADILVQSRPDKELAKTVEETKDGDGLFVINSAGEYEKGGVFVTGLKIDHQDHFVYTFETEGLHLFYCGALHRLPTEQELENIENIDVLFVPVGGGGALAAKEAAELVSALEPRVVIPLHYHLPGLKTKLEGLDAFLKIMGAKSPETSNKIKIVKKDLPQEETKILLLSPND